MTTLAKMRKSGVTFELDGDSFTVQGADPAQIAAIKEDKPQILAALQAEALTGVQLYENSILAAGVEASYRQTVDNLEFGAAQPECRALIGKFDAISNLPLAQALTLYLAEMPEIERLTDIINESRRLMLEGRHLQMAAESVFRPKPSPKPQKETLNAHIF